MLKRPRRRVATSSRQPAGRGYHRLQIESLEERQVLATLMVTVTADSGAGSLRQAILDANAMAGPDDIQFAIPGAGPHTISLLSELPTITETLDINGYTQAGATENTAGFPLPLNTNLEIELDGSGAPAAHGLILGAGSDGSTIRGLVINSFDLNGILVESDNNAITGNFIGTDTTGEVAAANGADGVQVRFATQNRIGGVLPADRNLISGNLRNGIFLFGIHPAVPVTDTQIGGNFVGTDKDGEQPLGNAACGIEIIGGLGNDVGIGVVGNLISSNGEEGVNVEAGELNGITWALIGTDRTGTLAMGNALQGISVRDANDTSILLNTIAFNLGAGVTVEGNSEGNLIVPNSMFLNAGLGIDLGNNGPTPNDPADPDAGPNRLQNFPVFTATLGGGTLTLEYSVPTDPANATYPLSVAFYRTDSAGQEGETLLGSTTYNAGDFPGTVSFPLAAAPVAVGDQIVATVTDSDGNTSEFSPSVIVQPIMVAGDPFEPNDTLQTATVLGSVPEITLRDLSIEANDNDFFRFTAHSTGKLVVNALFTHADGDIDMEILDSAGNQIALADSVTDNESLVIPVVSQQVYIIHTYGFAGDVNPSYSLEIENFPAPVPTSVSMDPLSDSGMFNDDEVTNITAPSFFVQADLSDFAAMGIQLLDTVNAAAGNVPGVGVFVSLTDAAGNVQEGFASPVGASSTLWSFQLPPLTDQRYFVSAAAYVVDGQLANAQGRTQLSVPLPFTIDTTIADPPAPTLLESSDTGMDPTDSVTNKSQPALVGTTEPNAKVRIFATNIVTTTTNHVGSGVATTAGNWEITVEPLADGVYEFSVVVEDIAGNVSNNSDPTTVLIDTLEPNTPLLDLLNDTGISATDNITEENLLNFLMIGSDTIDGNGNPGGIIYRLYWRPGDGTGEVLVYDSFTEFAGYTTLGQLDRTVSQTLNDPLGVPFPEGVQNFKLEIEDRAGNLSHDFLLNVEIDAIPPIAADIDLIDSSDSGMFNDDNVTNKMEPAFTGISEVGATVTLYAQELDSAGNPIGGNFIVGTGVVGSDLTDGLIGDGLGSWEITSEPLDDGTYNITALVEDAAGGNVTVGPLQIWIDTTQPNTPYLDLASASDSGRSDTDNVTNVNRPTMTISANDTVNGVGNLLPNGIKYRLYIRPDGDLGTSEILVIDSFAALGDFTIDGIFNHIVTLTLNNPAGTVIPDGVHDFKLEIEDRAGNISEDYLLDVTFDTVAPAVTLLGIQPGNSDTGVIGAGATFGDLVTSDDQTGFVGRAEANAIVRLYADGREGINNDNNLIDNPTLFSLTLAQPFNGNDALPDGQWSTTFIHRLNNTNFFDYDGVREILVEAEDLAGNINRVNDGQGDNGQVLDIFIDTQGPQITSVRYGGDPVFNLFSPKATEGPTPLSNQLVLTVRDFPRRSNQQAAFLYDAVFEDVAEVVGNYRLVGDANGLIGLVSVVFVPDALADNQPATGTLTLTFDEFLPDDRYTLTTRDSIVDHAGNRLDGESHASGPLALPLFPSGDFQPGGDFVARFTVDSRPEIGAWAGGSVYIDTNGNFLFDPENADTRNEDLIYLIGFTADDVFAGNFAALPGDVADGFDKIAAYGDIGQNSTSTDFRWLIDLDNDGVADINVADPANINGLPVAGNFDGDLTNGDEVGVFTGTTWWFDTDHDFRVDTPLVSAIRGLPIVGDFDGDGIDDLGTYNESQDRFEFDLGRNGTLDEVIYFGFAGVRERPVAADMDQDGVDDIGLWVPDRGGPTPREAAEWYFLVSGGVPAVIGDDVGAAANPFVSLFDRVTTSLDFGQPTIAFTPVPFGPDIFAQFGDEFALPIVGNFDPPVVSAAQGSRPMHNSGHAIDVNNDTYISPIDALLVINSLGTSSAAATPALGDGSHYYPDVNGDNVISPLDALMVINGLTNSASGAQAAYPAYAAMSAGSSSDDDDQTFEDVLSLLAGDVHQAWE